MGVSGVFKRFQERSSRGSLGISETFQEYSRELQWRSRGFQGRFSGFKEVGFRGFMGALPGHSRGVTRVFMGFQ